MKKIMTIAFALLLFATTHAQYVDDGNEIHITYDLDHDVKIDTTLLVNKHDAASYFVKQSNKYNEWVYKLNVQRNKGIDNNKIDVDQIIYTLENNGEIWYDTLYNLVKIPLEAKPKKVSWWNRFRSKFTSFRADKILDEQNLKGNLPDGVINWVSTNRKGMECGLKIVEEKSNVKMEMINKNGDVVHTFVDGELRRGWNSFEWRRQKNNKGTYQLSIEVDGCLMTQNVKIK